MRAGICDASRTASHIFISPAPPPPVNYSHSLSWCPADERPSTKNCCLSHSIPWGRQTLGPASPKSLLRGQKGRLGGGWGEVGGRRQGHRTRWAFSFKVWAATSPQKPPLPKPLGEASPASGLLGPFKPELQAAPELPSDQQAGSLETRVLL